MNNYEKLKEIEQLGIIRIIYILKKEGPMLTSKIQEKLNISNDSYYKARNKLIDLKIIKRDMNNYGTISPFYLTEKGIKIAEELEKLIEIL